MNQALRVQNLKKTFGKNTAAFDISFEISEGEIFGILGPNGAGKSTILSIITGLLRPDRGEVSIFRFGLKENFVNALKKVGVLLETPGFFVHLTAFDNLKIFGRLKKATKEDILSCLDKVGLEDQSKRKVKEFSQGMKKRLGLANALLGRPKLLVLDEPTNSLDPKGARKILDLIRELSSKEKLSVIISSNLLHDVETVCERVVLIDKGRVLFSKPVKEMLKPKKNIFDIKVIPQKKALQYLKSERGIKTELTGEHLRVYLESISSGEINRLLMNKGFEVQEISPVHISLQELFLNLSHKDVT